MRAILFVAMTILLLPHKASADHYTSTPKYTQLSLGIFGVPSALDGLRVEQVIYGADAFEDIKPGDVITHVNGHAVTTNQDIADAIKDNNRKRPVAVVVMQRERPIRTENDNFARGRFTKKLLKLQPDSYSKWLLTGVKKERDSVSGVTWYRHQDRDAEEKTGLSILIHVSPSNKPIALLKVLYVESGIADIEQLTVLADSQRFQVELPKNIVKTNSPTGIARESCHIALAPPLEWLNAAQSSRKTTIRYTGRRLVVDHKVGSDEKARLAQMKLLWDMFLECDVTDETDVPTYELKRKSRNP